MARKKKQPNFKVSGELLKTHFYKDDELIGILSNTDIIDALPDQLLWGLLKEQVDEDLNEDLLAFRDICEAARGNNN